MHFNCHFKIARWMRLSHFAITLQLKNLRLTRPDVTDLETFLYGEEDSKLSKMVAKERPGRLSKREINIALHGRMNREKWGGRFCDYGSAFLMEMRERGILLRGAALVREFVWQIKKDKRHKNDPDGEPDIVWEVWVDGTLC